MLDDFEGTLVLEAIARINATEAFMAAIDSDDLEEVASLMRQAKIDEATIEEVLKRTADPGDNH